MKNFKQLFATLPLALLLTSCGITKDNNSDVKSVHTLRSGLYKTYAGAGTEIEFGPVAGAGVDLTIKGMNHEKITLGSSNGTNWLFEGKGCTIKADVISSSMVQVTQEGPCEYYGFPLPDKFNLSGAFVLKPTSSVQKL